MSNARPPPTEHDPDETQPVQRFAIGRVSALRDVVLEKYRSGEFSSALSAAEVTLAAEPDNDEVAAIAESCRLRLRRRLAIELGTTRVPSIVADLASLNVSPSAAFVLTRIDGRSTVEEVVDACGLPGHETLEILCSLHRAGAIRLS